MQIKTVGENPQRAIMFAFFGMVEAVKKYLKHTENYMNAKSCQ